MQIKKKAPAYADSQRRIQKPVAVPNSHKQKLLHKAEKLVMKCKTNQEKRANMQAELSYLKKMGTTPHYTACGVWLFVSNANGNEQVRYNLSMISYWFKAEFQLLFFFIFLLIL